MRDIRFRAWDKEAKNMYWFNLPDKGADTTQRELEHRELMQYTGLQDKNGVEIFEGDVVQLGDKSVEVRWLAACFYAGENRLSRDAWESEVIGNIYETPELLK